MQSPKIALSTFNVARNAKRGHLLELEFILVLANNSGCRIPEAAVSNQHVNLNDREEAYRNEFLEKLQMKGVSLSADIGRLVCGS